MEKRNPSRYRLCSNLSWFWLSPLTTKVTTLPAQGNGVVAIATSKGMPAAPIVSKVIHFSGYDWSVRNAASDRGGQPNSYDPLNVWTDKNGYLHLRMEEHDGLRTCAEVSLTRSLGYGSYIFVVQDTGHFGPSAVSGVVLQMMTFETG